MKARLNLALVLLKEQEDDEAQKKAFEMLISLMGEYDPVVYQHIGLCYENGCGIKISAEQAKQYLQKAMELGLDEDESFMKPSDAIESLRKDRWRIRLHQTRTGFDK